MNLFVANTVLSIKRMAEQDYFYEGDLAALRTVELVRIAQQMPIQQPEMMINILRLIRYIVERYESTKQCRILSPDNSFDALQIINLTSAIIRKPQLPTALTIEAAEVLLGITMPKPIQDKPTQGNTVKAVMESLIHYMVHLKEDLDQMDKAEIQLRSHIVSLICQMNIDLITILETYKDRIDPAFCIRTNKEIPQSMRGIIFEILEIGRKNENAIFKFLTFLNVYFNHPSLESSFVSIAQYLKYKRFLIWIMMIYNGTSNLTLRLTCKQSMAYVIVVLSSDEFDLTKWNGGKDEFQREIFDEVLKRDDLEKPMFSFEDNDPITMSAIIYVYFYCLDTYKVVYVEAEMLPRIINLIMNMTVTQVPLITKCLLLIFVKSSSHLNQYTDSAVKEVNVKFTNLIVHNVRDVYSHQAELLRWAFECKVPVKIQHNLLDCWLETPDKLPDDLLICPTVFWRLVEILNKSNEPKTNVIAESIKRCFDKCNPEMVANMKQLILFNLEQILDDCIKYDRIANERVLAYILEFSFDEEMFARNEVAKIEFILSRLSSIIKYVAISNENLNFNIIWMLVLMANGSIIKGCNSVFLRIMQNDAVLKYLERVIRLDLGYSSIAMEFVALCGHYVEHNNIEPSTTIEIEIFQLIDLLTTKDVEKQCSIVNLIFVIFSCPRSGLNINKLISLHPQLNEEEFLNAIGAINFQLQMLCCQDDKKLSKISFKCLILLNQKNESIDQIWTKKFIEYHLKKSETSDEFKEFIAVMEKRSKEG